MEEIFAVEAISVITSEIYVIASTSAFTQRSDSSSGTGSSSREGSYIFDEVESCGDAGGSSQAWHHCRRPISSAASSPDFERARRGRTRENVERDSAEPPRPAAKDDSEEVQQGLRGLSGSDNVRPSQSTAEVVEGLGALETGVIAAADPLRKYPGMRSRRQLAALWRASATVCFVCLALPDPTRRTPPILSLYRWRIQTVTAIVSLTPLLLLDGRHLTLGLRGAIMPAGLEQALPRWEPSQTTRTLDPDAQRARTRSAVLECTPRRL
jgi:hypothetical protein